MVVFLIIYIIVCFYGMKICTEKEPALKPVKAVTVSGQKWNDYMSKEKTGAVKGIFVLMVFISHFCSSFTGNAGDVLVHKYITLKFNQLMVTMFLFYSGYGIMESIKKKGGIYVKNLPVQRILKLLFDFDIAVLLYLLLDMILGRPQKPMTILAAFFAWDNIGNSDWYVFAILWLYIFSFIGFTVSKKNHYVSAAIVTFLCGVYVVSLLKIKHDWWFNTVICYVFGMWFSLFRELFEKIVQRSNVTWAISFAASLAGFCIFFHQRKIFVMYEISCIFFVLCVLLFTMKVSVDNKILRKFGEFVFGVYILQKIPLMICDKLGFLDSNPYLCFIACLVITFILAIGFNYFTGLTAKLFNKFRIKEHA